MTIPPVFLFTVLVVVLTVGAMLLSFSTAILRNMAVHDLASESQRLRREYARRLAEHRRGRPDNAGIEAAESPTNIAKAA